MATGACDNRSVCSVQGPVVGRWSISWGGYMSCDASGLSHRPTSSVVWAGP